MNTLQPVDTITRDPGYEAPAILRESGSLSAFDRDVRLQQNPASRQFLICRGRGTWHVSPDENGARVFTTTLTNALGRMLDLTSGFASELCEKAQSAREVLQSYKTRIETLRTEAALDGFAINPASEVDFLSFIRSEPFGKAGLVLMDNGNLRAVWKGEGGSHVGLQFLGNRSIQYVIFKHREGAGQISRVAGRDNLDGVKRQLQAFDLASLLYA
jgi:hypothetical protein